MNEDTRKLAQTPAITLYKGKVMHARLSPVAHRFTYAMDSILIDIDRLEEAGRSRSAEQR